MSQAHVGSHTLCVIRARSARHLTAYFQLEITLAVGAQYAPGALCGSVIWIITYGNAS